MDFSQDQGSAWDLLQGSSDNVFITGEAGSGKSFLIREFMRFRDSKSFPVLASTGAAAVLVGGRTFHSFMGLGIMEGGVERTVERALKDRKLLKRLNKIEGFVLDEVSMLSGPTLRAAEEICRKARDMDLLPWGGLRVIAVGDFAQLPPVDQFQGRKPWAFQDVVWEQSRFQSVCLRQNLRTRDVKYLEILNDVRGGRLTPRVEEFLHGAMVEDGDGDESTRLFPLRHQTDNYNLKKLSAVDGTLQSINSVYSGPEREILRLKKVAPLPDILHLKVGCLVMLRVNDPRMRWVNGSTGHIRRIHSDHLEICLMSGRNIEIEKFTFGLLSPEGHTVASVTNFPVQLAYAATIHKAQGMTLDRARVNLSGLWEPGQAYVAMSRVTEAQGLQVESWTPSSIRADPEVEKFYLRFKNSPQYPVSRSELGESPISP